jgi:hypothetical protein
MRSAARPRLRGSVRTSVAKGGSKGSSKSAVTDEMKRARVTAPYHVARSSRMVAPNSPRHCWMKHWYAAGGTPAVPDGRTVCGTGADQSSLSRKPRKRVMMVQWMPLCGRSSQLNCGDDESRRIQICVKPVAANTVRSTQKASSSPVRLPVRVDLV